MHLVVVASTQRTIRWLYACKCSVAIANKCDDEVDYIASYNGGLLHSRHRLKIEGNDCIVGICWSNDSLLRMGVCALYSFNRVGPGEEQVAPPVETHRLESHIGRRVFR